MSAQQDNPRLTITLTGRPPVSVTKANWPVLGEATDKDWDNQYECQANRTWKWTLRVRHHADGRAIVYGIYAYTTHYQGENECHVRGGELLAPNDDIPAAILRVAAWMQERAKADAEGRFESLAHQCIASLPAESLD